MNAKSNQKPSNRFDHAIAIFQKHGGVLRTAQALKEGVHPATLYSLRDSGRVEAIERGLYGLTDRPPTGNPDLVTVAKKVPAAIVCLISALAYHDLTTQIPRQVHIALSRPAREPKLAYPPLAIYHLRDRAYSEGIESYKIDNIQVRIYSPEKTIADCFKFRNRIGLDVCLEALRLYRERRKVKIDLLLHYAAICRVESIMRPYLEAIM